MIATPVAPPVDAPPTPVSSYSQFTAFLTYSRYCFQFAMGSRQANMAMYDKQYGGYRIFIGDLGAKICKYNLEREFEKHGKISDIWMARSPPGFAFIVYKHADDAERAVSLMESRSVCGRRIRVEHARPFTKGEKSKGGRRGSDTHRGRIKKRGRIHHRRSSSRSSSESRSRSWSRSDKKRSSRYSRSDRSRSWSKDDRSSFSKDQDRRRSISRDRRDIKRSHSPEYDRWKRSRSDDSSDDEKYARKSEVVVAKKKKTDNSDTDLLNNKDTSEAEQSKKVPLNVELEVDENSLASISLPQEEKTESNTKKKDEVKDLQANSKAEKETKTQPPKKHPKENPADDSKVVPAGISTRPKENPTDDSKVVSAGISTTRPKENPTDDFNVVPAGISSRPKENTPDDSKVAPTGKSTTESDVAKLEAKGEKSKQEEQMDLTELVEEKKEDRVQNVEKAKMCTVETQTDFIPNDGGGVWKTVIKKEVLPKTRDQSTDTDLDGILLYVRDIETQMDSDGKDEANNRVGNACTCGKATRTSSEGLNGDPKSDIGRIASGKGEAAEGSSFKSKLVDRNGNKAVNKSFKCGESKQENSKERETLMEHRGNVLDSNGLSLSSPVKHDRKIKIEYLSSSRKILNGHVIDCFQNGNITDTFLQSKVVRNGDTGSWSKGIVLSDQTQILSPGETSNIGIKAM